MVTEIYAGYSIKAKVTVSNDTDGVSGDYRLRIMLKHETTTTTTTWYLTPLFEAGILTSYYWTNTASYISISMTTGASHIFNYTMYTPSEFSSSKLSGKIYGKVAIDDTDNTEIISTSWEEAYILLEKKKPKLSSLSATWSQ